MVFRFMNMKIIACKIPFGKLSKGNKHGLYFVVGYIWNDKTKIGR